MSTSAPWEYVADLVDRAAGPPDRRMDDRTEAVRSLDEMLTSRVAAVLATSDSPPGLMLSGGVDSMVVAASLVKHGVRPTCVTVCVPGFGDSELTAARAIAEHFELNHSIVALGSESLATYSAWAVEAVGTSELWEIGAAIPIRASFDELRSKDVSGPVFTGGGADVLLAGGKTLKALSPAKPPDVN